MELDILVHKKKIFRIFKSKDKSGFFSLIILMGNKGSPFTKIYMFSSIYYHF